jgi:hypothetical protein
MDQAQHRIGQALFLGGMIPARAINELIDRMALARPQPGARCLLKESAAGYSVSADDSVPLVIHPWNTTVTWNAKLKRWEGQVHAGFIGGIDPTVSVLDEATGKTIDAGLSGNPVILFTGFVDRTASAAGGSPLPIPQFFLQQGAGYDKSLSIGSDGQVSQGVNPPGWRRLLSLDLYLSVARIAVTGELSSSDNGDGTSTVSLHPRLNSQAVIAHGTRPRLLSIGNLKQKQEESAQQALFATYSQQAYQQDVPYDELLISTVFLLSPPGTDPSAPADGSWTAYVQHSVFYNLLYAAQNVVISSPTHPLNPIAIYTGLAGGLGDAIANKILQPINDAAAALQAGLAQIAQKGFFWTI